MEVERLKGKQFSKQVSVWVTEDIFERYVKLKKEKRINTAAELRKVLLDLVSKLEKAAG